MVAPGYWKFNYGERPSTATKKPQCHIGMTQREASMDAPERHVSGARRRSYFWAGGEAGFGAGCVFVGCVLTPCSTEPGPLCFVA